MNKEEIVKFVKWLQSNVDGFKDKNPEEIVASLNEMDKTDEGRSNLTKLITSYKQSTKMFRKGGKVDYLVNKYKSGGETNNKDAQDSTEKRSNINGRTYNIVLPDTINRTVYRKIFRPAGAGWDITIQKQVINEPSNTSYRQFRNVDPNENDGYPVIAEVDYPSSDGWFGGDKKLRKQYDNLFKELYNYK